MATPVRNMIHRRYVPRRPLNTIIDYLYYLDGAMTRRHTRILPLPVLDFKINLGGPIKMYEAEAGRDRETELRDSWSVGIYTVPHHIEWPTDVRLYGVRVKAGGAFPLLQLPLSDLHNQVAFLDGLWGAGVGEIREQLATAPTIDAGFLLLERFLLDRLRDAPHGLDIVQYAVRQITRTHGAISIRDLSDRIGISQNHLGTLFKRLVGIPAKDFARLVRFEYTLRTFDALFWQVTDLGEMAHRLGYYDQSHFNKDFMAYTGYSPTDLLVRRATVENHPVPHSLNVVPTD
jgi:AraC-like DNA-binding protein